MQIVKVLRREFFFKKECLTPLCLSLVYMLIFLSQSEQLNLCELN